MKNNGGRSISSGGYRAPCRGAGLPLDKSLRNCGRLIERGAPLFSQKTRGPPVQLKLIAHNGGKIRIIYKKK